MRRRLRALPPVPGKGLLLEGPVFQRLPVLLLFASNFLGLSVKETVPYSSQLPARDERLHVFPSFRVFREHESVKLDDMLVCVLGCRLCS